MTGAGDMVEDDRGDFNIGAVTGKPLRQRRHGSALSAHIDDQNHGKSKMGGKIGGRAAATGGPVEQPHNTLTENEFGALRQCSSASIKAFDTHRPAIEIDASVPCRSRVIGSINIIWPRLERHRGDP